MTENLKIWKALSKTDQSYAKPFNRGGFKGTAVNPTWQLQRLTEQFGPVGFGWYYEVTDTQVFPSGQGHHLVYLGLNLYVKMDGEWSKPIHGRGGDFIVNVFEKGPKADDEAFKKAETDALGNAMKKLGMSADVYLGQFDDNKLTRAADPLEDKPKDINPATKTATSKEAMTRMLASIDKQTTPEKVDAEYDRALKWAKENKFYQNQIDQLEIQRDNTKARLARGTEEDLDQQYAKQMEKS